MRPKPSVLGEIRVFDAEHGFPAALDIKLFLCFPYCNFVPIRVARNLGKPTQTFANLACVEISSPPTLKVAILTLKVSTMASTWGRVN